MHHIEGCARDQSQLLPARVDDYVHADNPVRYIDAFIDGLDLATAGFGRVQPKGTGRPGYDPGDLPRLYIYGYLNRVRSSRQTETQRNLEVIWLLRGLRPDFKTIADFRRDNRAAFKAVFREFVLLCRTLDLYGRPQFAVDGTRLKAVNNCDRDVTREKLAKFLRDAEERLADYLERLDCTDAEEGPANSARAKGLAEKIASLKQRRTRYTELQAELERMGESQMSLTDRDSRAMAAHPKGGAGYNAQVAVDAKNKLIVAFEVTNAGSDLGLLAQTASAAKGALEVETIQAVADRGYYKGEDIQACEQAGIEAYFAPAARLGRPRRVFSQGGVHLRRRGRHLPVSRAAAAASHILVHVPRRGPMVLCQPSRLPVLRDPAAMHRHTHRVVARWVGEAVLDRMEARLAARPDILDRRREIVELRFGSIKQWMNQWAFLMRGLERVRAEFSLTALAYNMTWAINLVGVPGLMKAV